MKSVLGSIQAEGRLDHLNHAIRGFEDERRCGGNVDIENHWRGADSAKPGDVAVLAALVKSDLRQRFVAGESPAVAEYIERFPELRGSDSRVLSLIYEEYCLREEKGEGLDVESFCGRYPDWKDSLASQLQYHQMISQAAGLASLSPKFPNPGDEFGEFELESVLGTGGSSRVFLARDTSLGDRLVVLKVAVDRGNEPMILGRLVHPRIVWVNSVSYQPESQLRGLSMPYHPGRPLDEIIKGHVTTSLPRHARVFWDVLMSDRGTTAPPVPVIGDGPAGSKGAQSLKRGEPTGDGWKGFPIHGTYAQGVAWIGKVLAEALHHAHGKQTFHRDIKPGNVLMTLSQGPQLLDFNLAESPHSAERADDALHGGTLPYMAPEQVRAFLDPTRWEQVGAGADIYSLGLVLWELLTGRLPDLPDEKLPRSRALADFLDRRACLDLSLRRLNPSVPHALETIIAGCLAYNPEARYPDAAALAVDLERFLELRPLKFARNPCRQERLANWLGRNRRLVELGIAASIGVATLLNPVPVELLPAFNQAMSAYRQKHLDEAIEPLKRLAAAYPLSPLPDLFLGLARGTSKLDRRAAEESFRRAMGVPDAIPKVVSWASSHPEIGLIKGLDEFGDRCQADSKASPGSEERANLQLLARQAFGLALEIDPRYGKSLQGIATFEESQGHYELAFEIISRCLNNHCGPHEDRVATWSLLMGRSRIAVSWADRLRAGGGPDANRESQDLLTGAIADLDQGDRLGIVGEGYVDHRFRSFYIRMLASLSLAETELDLDNPQAARQPINQAEKSLGKLSQMGTGILHESTIRQRIAQASRRIQATVQAPSGLPIGPAHASIASPDTIADTDPKPK